MEDLAAEAEKIGYFLDTYKKAAEASVVGNERVADDRTALAKAAEAYAQSVADYAAFKTAQWDKELSAKYPAPDALRQHESVLPFFELLTIFHSLRPQPGESKRRSLPLARRLDAAPP